MNSLYVTLVIGLTLLVGLIIVTVGVISTDLGWKSIGHENTAPEHLHGRALENRLGQEQVQIGKLEEELKEIQREVDRLQVTAAKAEEASDEFALQVENNRIDELALLEKEENLKRLDAILDAYKENFQPKIIVPTGKVFPLLKSVNEAYSNASIVRREGELVTIRHSTGFAQINVVDLPSIFLPGSVPPPQVAEIPYRVEEVLQERPTELLSSEIKLVLEKQDRASGKKEREEDLKEQELAAQLERKRLNEEQARADADSKERLAQMNEKLAREKAKRDQVALQIREKSQEISKLYSLRQQIQAEKYQKESAYRSARIKPDRKEYARIIAGYDNRLRQISDEITRLQSEMSALR